MQSKPELREKYRIIRDTVFSEDDAYKFAKNFFDQIKIEKWQIIASYYPIDSEADVSEINNQLVDMGCDVVLPCIDGDNLIFRKWNGYTEMTDGKIPEPLNSDIVPAEEIDIFIVPLLAYNSENYRLGYGGGYYDRILSDTEAQKIGIAYKEQFSKSLTPEPHDIPLDMVINP